MENHINIDMWMVKKMWARYIMIYHDIIIYPECSYMSFVQFIDCHPGHTCGSLHEVEDLSKDESLRPGPAMGAAG
jgi:hypothetical protein